MTNTERKKLIVESFQTQFERFPEVWTRAPGRVDLMGSHTDYNLGYVMTMTIDRDTWIAARPRVDRLVNIYSINTNTGSQFDLDKFDRDALVPWTNYVRGIASVLIESGQEIPGFDGVVHSTIPFASGLSSSAALEMATVIVFNILGNLDLDPLEMALIGQKAENSFVGIQSGILDQYSSIFGQADQTLLLDCRSLSSTGVQFPDDIRAVICDTRAVRNLVGSEYDLRRSQCEMGVKILKQYLPEILSLRDVSIDAFLTYETSLPEIVLKRCRFVIEENQRVLDMALALPTGERERLRQLMISSWEGARNQYEISSPAMEAMISAMQNAPGVIGARQAGAGFGGCMVALVEAGEISDFSEFVLNAYLASTGITANIYVVKATPGAGILSSLSSQ